MSFMECPRCWDVHCSCGYFQEEIERDRMKNDRQRAKEAKRQAEVNAFNNCEHKTEYPIQQAIDEVLVTFMCCQFCGKERVLGVPA